MAIVLGAIELEPDRIVLTLVVPGDGPGPRQRMIEGGYLVMQEIGVGRIEIEPLLENGLIVGVERNAGVVEIARPPEAAGLDLEHVVTAILAGPAADRVALEQGAMRAGQSRPSVKIRRSSVR